MLGKPALFFLPPRNQSFERLAASLDPLDEFFLRLRITGVETL
jgi:hypothetical protein